MIVFFVILYNVLNFSGYIASSFDTEKSAKNIGVLVQVWMMHQDSVVVLDTLLLVLLLLFNNI